MLIRLVIILLVVLLFPVSTIAETTPLKIWSLSVVSADILRNKTEVYFSMLSSTIHRSYQSHFGVDVKKLQSNCHINKYDVIFTSYDRETKKMEQECNLVTIGLTDQEIYLFSLQNSKLGGINSIGVVSFTAVKDIAEAAIPGLLNKPFGVVEFPNNEKAILALLRHEVDAIVTSASSKTIVSTNFDKKIIPIHTFSNKSHAVVLFSKSFYNSKDSLAVRKAILRNGTESRALFQDFLGFGKWYKPSS